MSERTRSNGSLWWGGSSEPRKRASAVSGSSMIPHFAIWSAHQFRGGSGSVSFPAPCLRVISQRLAWLRVSPIVIANAPTACNRKHSRDGLFHSPRRDFSRSDAVGRVRAGFPKDASLRSCPCLSLSWFARLKWGTTLAVRRSQTARMGRLTTYKGRIGARPFETTATTPPTARRASAGSEKCRGPWRGRRPMWAGVRNRR